MEYRPGPQRAVIGLLAAMAVGLLTACGGSAAGSAGSTSVESELTPTGSADQVRAPAVQSVTGGELGQVCQNLLAIDSVPLPDTGPAADPAANVAYGKAVGPLLAAAVDAAPAALASQLNLLVPIVAASEKGAALPVDDPSMLTAIATYESWAQASCGFQQVELMAMDYEFDGAPESLAAGPTSLSLMNHSTKGESHIAAIGRLRPGQQVGPRELVDMSLDQLGQYLEVLPNSAAASPGQTVGVLVDLTPGHYFLLCTSQSDDADPTTGHLYKGMLAEFDVE
ncbi:MAG: hypothetical protein ABWZ02_00690 [Nakamurella sp.]